MDFERIKTPTGHICIMQGELGRPLEFLSLGDYGKEKNIKADFMGITREINGVPHGELLPLEEKWVITISTQYGCSMGCKFCDVPQVGKGRNATFNDLVNQVKYALSLHPEVKTAKRINLHYARMGEPTFNIDVISSAYYLKGVFDGMGFGFHPNEHCPYQIYGVNCGAVRIEDDPEAMKAIEILRGKGITPEQVRAWYGKREVLP